jgi:hypothetical protein
MTNRIWFKALIVGILAVVYIRNFTTWFRTSPLQITITSRPGRPGVPPDQAAPIVFGLDNEYELKSVKVLSLSSLQTNGAPVTVWQLDKTKKASNTPAIRGFPYGDPIDGLQPPPALSDPQPLVPGLPYRILVTSTRNQGERDFTPAAAGE